METNILNILIDLYRQSEGYYHKVKFMKKRNENFNRSKKRVDDLIEKFKDEEEDFEDIIGLYCADYSEITFVVGMSYGINLYIEFQDLIKFGGVQDENE